MKESQRTTKKKSPSKIFSNSNDSFKRQPHIKEEHKYSGNQTFDN
jgi:hypothetical protein